MFGPKKSMVEGITRAINIHAYDSGANYFDFTRPENGNSRPVDGNSLAFGYLGKEMNLVSFAFFHLDRKKNIFFFSDRFFTKRSEIFNSENEA